MIDMNKLWQDPNQGQGAAQQQLGNAQPWTKWGELAQPNVGDDQWSRSPAWGAHVINSPEYGWQDKPTVNKLYAQGGDLSSLTPQMGSTWQEYYGDRFSGKERRQRQAQGLGVGARQQQPAADYSQYFNQGQQQQPLQQPVPQTADQMGGGDKGRPMAPPLGDNYEKWKQDFYTNEQRADLIAKGVPESEWYPTGGPGGGSDPGQQVGIEPWQMGQQQAQQPYPTSQQANIRGLDAQQQYPNYQQQGGQFQYPQQMNTASDVMTNFAQGAPTQMPWQWGQGSNVANQMAQTGMPTSFEPAYQASKGVVQQDIVDSIKQAGEQAGVEGLRYSTVHDQASKRIAAEKMGQLGAQWTGQELGAQESARGRQMQALPQMYQFGAGGAGLTESAKDRGLSAAGGLAGLGQQYANLPMDWSQRMMGMGSQMYGQDQSALNRQYQDYMRMSPENNPYMNYGMQFGQQPSQMGYQQYQPSLFGQLLGLGGTAAAGAAGLGWSPFG